MSSHTRFPRRWPAWAVLAGLAASACSSAGGAYHPEIDPSRFRPGVDHPFLPLVPGTIWRYQEDETSIVVTVLAEPRVVLGIPCVVVRDTEMEDGRVIEDTYDWFAQDQDGNVWYFGEDTRAYRDDGSASMAGSWEAGAGGAWPGIVMPADPAPGPSYRQEYRPGVAEDMGQVVALDETVVTPYGTFSGCVKTRDWSPLERGFEWKWYAPGVGFVRAATPSGHGEQLVALERPR